VSVDAAGDVLLADTGNNRVLLYPASEVGPSRSTTCATFCAVPATGVWGQNGSFSSSTANIGHSQSGNDPCPQATIGTPTPCNLSGPTKAVGDTAGTLYIADGGNGRVLEYDSALLPGIGRQAATLTLGATSGLTVSGGTGPGSVGLDAGGNVWVADTADNRTLAFPPALGANRTRSLTAVEVLGQRGLFSATGANTGGIDGGSLSAPNDVVADGAGTVYVADTGNNRILAYAQPYPIVARVGLAPGWNLVSLPSATPFRSTGGSVVAQVNRQGGNVLEIAVFSNGQYTTYVPGFSSDFALSPKQGIWVLSGTSSVWAQT
jgi:hypothetical protein